MAATMRIPTEFIAIDKFTSVVSKMTSGVSGFTKTTSSAIDRFNMKANKVAGNMAIAGTAIAAPLALAVNKAVEFEDKMADVAKTTGLSGKPLENYGKALLDMSKKTRTGIDDLIKIGEVGGQLGIAKEDLISFTEASNKFAVALGEDYGGTEQAISQVGKINSLFKDTRGLDAAASISKVGSAINELGAVGSGTSANINDFILRVGALPDAIKPTLTQTAALGTFFEEVGIDSQIAAGGFSNFLLVAGKNIGGFASQMGISTSAAKELFAQNPSKFATIFAKSLNGLKPDQLAVKLDALKIGSQETIKVLGALGTGSERLGSLMDVSSNAFVKATSLTDEYNKKNETTAAKLARAKNGIDAFMITLGTQLLPILTKIIDKITPVINAIGDWISANPVFATTLVTIVGILATLVIAIKSVVFALELWKAAQLVLNLIMTANPIGLIIVAIAALIALIGVIIYKWDEWGASIALILGPIGWVISLIQSFRRNWDMIVNAFKTDGIIAGLKAIGATILDAVLQPLEQLLGLIARIPGMGTVLAPAIAGIKTLREGLGVNLEGNTPSEKLDSPEQVNAKMMQENRVSGGVNVNIRDRGNNVESAKPFGNSGIPVNVTSTQGQR